MAGCEVRWERERGGASEVFLILEVGWMIDRILKMDETTTKADALGETV